MGAFGGRVQWCLTGIKHHCRPGFRFAVGNLLQSHEGLSCHFVTGKCAVEFATGAGDRIKKRTCEDGKQPGVCKKQDDATDVMLVV